MQEGDDAKPAVHHSKRRCDGSAFVLLAALVVTPLVQITMRGVFNVPMAGAEELARYFLICLSFVAASYVTQKAARSGWRSFRF